MTDSLRRPPASLPAGLLTAPAPGLTHQSGPYASASHTVLTVSSRPPVTRLKTTPRIDVRGRHMS